MFTKATPLFLVCETPLHAGSGDSLGVVDLPIQRERHTSFPKIEGSSLKGALRQAFNGLSSGCTTDPDQYREAITLSFGPEETGGDGHAGALGFTDARLLLFPVKSMKGVFGWITCPKVLQQFEKDMDLTGSPYPHDIPLINNCVPINCTLFVKDKEDKRIVLEEYTFQVEEDGSDSEECTLLAKWLSRNVSGDNYWKEKMEKDIVVLSDEDFTDFVNLSTEVITRTKIDNETGTVAQGQLFTEEYLPAESIMYSLVLASPIFKENDAEKGIFSMSEDNPCFTGCENEEDRVMKFFEAALPEVIQIGGNATLGKGLVRTRVFYESSVT